MQKARAGRKYQPQGHQIPLHLTVTGQENCESNSTLPAVLAGSNHLEEGRIQHRQRKAAHNAVDVLLEIHYQVVMMNKRLHPTNMENESLYGDFGTDSSVPYPLIGNLL